MSRPPERALFRQLDQSPNKSMYRQWQVVINNHEVLSLKKIPKGQKKLPEDTRFYKMVSTWDFLLKARKRLSLSLFDCRFIYKAVSLELPSENHWTPAESAADCRDWPNYHQQIVEVFLCKLIWLGSKFCYFIDLFWETDYERGRFLWIRSSDRARSVGESRRS